MLEKEHPQTTDSSAKNLRRRRNFAQAQAEPGVVVNSVGEVMFADGLFWEIIALSRLLQVRTHLLLFVNADLACDNISQPDVTFKGKSLILDRCPLSLLVLHHSL